MLLFKATFSSVRSNAFCSVKINYFSDSLHNTAVSVRTNIYRFIQGLYKTQRSSYPQIHFLIVIKSWNRLFQFIPFNQILVWPKHNLALNKKKSKKLSRVIFIYTFIWPQWIISATKRKLRNVQNWIKSLSYSSVLWPLNCLPFFSLILVFCFVFPRLQCFQVSFKMLVNTSQESS